MGQGLEPTMATWEMLLVALRWSRARVSGGRCSSSSMRGSSLGAVDAMEGDGQGSLQSETGAGGGSFDWDRRGRKHRDCLIGRSQ